MLNYFRELEDPSIYLKKIARLRRDKLLTHITCRDLDNLVSFANVHKITAVILLGTRYDRKKYPKKVNRVNWWPWIEFVIFHSNTGLWWTVASGNTSRLREVHNTLVDYIYTGHTRVPVFRIHFPGTTVVYDMDVGRAKISEMSPIFLVGYDLGMNYEYNPLENVDDEYVIAYSSPLLSGKRQICLARYPQLGTPYEVLF